MPLRVKQKSIKNPKNIKKRIMKIASQITVDTFKLFFPKKYLGVCKLDHRWRASLIQQKLVVVYKMSTSQDSKTLFKLNFTCIFLSARAKFKKKHNRRLCRSLKAALRTHCFSHSSSLFWPRSWPSTKSSTV